MFNKFLALTTILSVSSLLSSTALACDFRVDPVFCSDKYIDGVGLCLATASNTEVYFFTSSPNLTGYYSHLPARKSLLADGRLRFHTDRIESKEVGVMYSRVPYSTGINLPADWREQIRAGKRTIIATSSTMPSWLLSDKHEKDISLVTLQWQPRCGAPDAF